MKRWYYTFSDATHRQTFRRTVAISTSGLTNPRRIAILELFDPHPPPVRALWSFKISIKIYDSIWHNIPQDRIQLQNICYFLDLFILYLPAGLKFAVCPNSVFIQGVSRVVDITAGGDFLGLCDQKSSYKHVSDFGRLRSYDRLKLRIEGNDYWK